MKSELLQKISDCLNKSREGLDSQQENTEDSSEPRKVRETGVSRCAPHNVGKGEGPTASSNGEVKKESPGPETCRIRPRPVTLRRPSITVQKKACVKIRGVHGHRAVCRSSQRLRGAKKDPRARLFGGLSKIPVSGQPSKGEGSLPCRLFPSDFLCQALRKSTCAKLMVLKFQTWDRLNTRPSGDAAQPVVA
jgi:hypothetical protein